MRLTKIDHIAYVVTLVLLALAWYYQLQRTVYYQEKGYNSCMLASQYGCDPNTFKDISK